MNEKWFKLGSGSPEEKDAIGRGFLQYGGGRYASLALKDENDMCDPYEWITPEEGSLCRINNEYHDLEFPQAQTIRQLRSLQIIS